MEALVYENSPLADYLRGKMFWVHSGTGTDPWLLGEGEDDEKYAVDENDTKDDSPAATPNFAPRGLSRFQARIRYTPPKSPGKHMATLSRIYDVCTVRVVPILQLITAD